MTLLATSPFEADVEVTREWLEGPRFAGNTRLHSARQVVEQRGTIPADHTVAREAAGPSTSAFASSSPRVAASRRSVPTPRDRASS